MARRETHRYRLVASVEPRDLLLALRKTCEQPRFREQKPDFDFDWMKRKIAVSAHTRESAEALRDAVLSAVEKKAGAGHLLPGAPLQQDGRWTVPIGVLLQTPDVYTEMFAASLQELGITGVELEDDGTVIAIPISGVALALDYRSIVAELPLPPYMRLVDEGASASE